MTSTQTTAPAGKATTAKPTATAKPATPKAAKVVVGLHRVKRFRLAVKGIDCAGSCPNGHITKAAAIQCQASAAHGVDDKDVKMITNDRLWGSVKIGSAAAQICSCRFGHKAESTALACAGKLARTMGVKASPVKATAAAPATTTTKATTPRPTPAKRPAARPATAKSNVTALRSSTEGTIGKA